MKKGLKFVLAALAVTFIPLTMAAAEMVKSLDFVGKSSTELVEVEVRTDKQFMKYSTPNRDYNYDILDYDCSSDPQTGQKVFTATLMDKRLKTATNVVIYYNGKYADMRIGKKQILFKEVQLFRIVSE